MDDEEGTIQTVEVQAKFVNGKPSKASLSCSCGCIEHYICIICPPIPQRATNGGRTSRSTFPALVDFPALSYRLADLRKQHVEALPFAL